MDGDPLADPAARDWAVRDYRSHLQAVAKAAPTTVYSALAAIDDLYTRRGLGCANAERRTCRTRHRGRSTSAQPCAGSAPLRRTWRRATGPCGPSLLCRARISEAVGLDVDDVRLSARKGVLRILGKGWKVSSDPHDAVVHTIAAGDSLLPPSVTRRVINRMAQQPTHELADQAKLDELTRREREVLELSTRGLSNREIAAALVVEESTIRTQVKRILMKLDLRDRVQAVIFACEIGVNRPAVDAKPTAPQDRAVR